MQSCNLKKEARKEGMYLYKNKINIKEKTESRQYSSGISAYIKQNPNKRFIGTFRLGLLVYKLGSNKKDNRLNRTLRNLGEAPVILDSALIEASIKGMRNYLRANGYYYPDMSYTVKGKPHKGKVTYHIVFNRLYHISGVYYHIADKKIDSIVRSKKDESFLRLGNPLKLENLLKEQNRISDILRNQGYFTFNKDLIKFDMDTSIGNYYTSIAININNEMNFETHKTYQINQVIVEIDNPLISDSSAIKDTIYHLEKFIYSPNFFPLNSDVLERSIFVEPKTLFKQFKSTSTFNRLNDLQIFNTVNINAVPINEKTDSAAINYFIKLNPAKKYDYTLEPQAITTDQANLVGSSYRNYGIAVQLTFIDKNIFHNAEIFQLRNRISTEAQRGKDIPKTPFFNSFENSLNASLTFPKLVFFNRIDRFLFQYTNRSIISASFIYEKNVDWIRNVYTAGFGYQFSKKRVRHNFSPMEISYIRTNFNNEKLKIQSQGDPYLQSVFNNNLITSIRYGFMFNNQTELKRKDYVYFRWELETAGNMLNLIYKALKIEKNDSGYRTFFGVQYFQYHKTYIDLRFNKYLDDNNRLASRIAIGLAVPVGNSPDYVPFDKRFFTGGANSLRAFIPRSIGPGSYNQSGQLDRSGDVKLEANLELRFNVFNHFLEGAVFVDAGNIWRIKEDGREEAAFKFNTFYNQLGVGTGIGLRLNLEFLIFRVDASFPISDPRKPRGERYVLNEYTNPGLLLDKTIFNFGVGYPF